jgi:hypothetical protein
MNTQNVTPKVKQLTGTKKKQFFLWPATTVAPRGGWSGGSCSYFEGLNYKTGAPVQFKQGDNFSVQTQQQELPANTVLIETGVFCGKPAFAKIMYRPEEIDAVKTFLGL